VRNGDAPLVDACWYNPQLPSELHGEISICWVV